MNEEHIHDRFQAPDFCDFNGNFFYRRTGDASKDLHQMTLESKNWSRHPKELPERSRMKELWSSLYRTYSQDSSMLVCASFVSMSVGCICVESLTFSDNTTHPVYTLGVFLSGTIISMTSVSGIQVLLDGLEKLLNNSRKERYYGSHS